MKKDPIESINLQDTSSRAIVDKESHTRQVDNAFPGSLHLAFEHAVTSAPNLAVWPSKRTIADAPCF